MEINDVTAQLSIFHVIGDAFETLFGGHHETKYLDPAICGTAGDYYVNNYLTCLTSAVDAKFSGSSAAAVESKLTAACTGKLGACYSGADQACQGMTAASPASSWRRAACLSLITCMTALIRARWVKAWGKLPRCRPDRGSISSAYSSSGLA